MSGRRQGGPKNLHRVKFKEACISPLLGPDPKPYCMPQTRSPLGRTDQRTDRSSEGGQPTLWKVLQPMDSINFPACPCSTPEPSTRGSQQSDVTDSRNPAYVMRGPTNDMNPGLLQVVFILSKGQTRGGAFRKKCSERHGGRPSL